MSNGWSGLAATKNGWNVGLEEISVVAWDKRDWDAVVRGRRIDVDLKS